MAERIKIHLEFETRLAPSSVADTLLDFSEGRLETWRSLDPAKYEVHETGPGWAIVTEGSAEPDVWARERYEWAGGRISIKALESNFCKPGDGTVIVITSNGSGGSSIVLDWEREPIDPTWEPLFEVIATQGEALLMEGYRGTWERLADEG